MKSTELSCSEFVSLLSSDAPAPGGGGAAALTAALGSALGAMVASLTIGKSKYADVQEEILTLKAQIVALQEQLLDLVTEDAEVFVPLSQAYGMPRGTAEEAAYRAEVMETCLIACAETPLKIMRCCAEALVLMEHIEHIGTEMAISDAGCGALTLEAALLAADLNVRVNTKLMQDKSRAKALNAEADALLKKHLPIAERTYEQVLARYS